MRDYSTRTTRTDVGSRMDWVRIGILAGFIATFAMTATLTGAWLFANWLGDPTGGQFTRWLANLSENRMAERVGDAVAIGIVLNLIVGVAWALIYGRFFEPMIDMRGILKGMLFAMIPFVISVAVVFPLMDAGFLGSDLGAGPLPFIGNLVLHLVYGGVLGFIFAIEQEQGIPDSAGDRQANATAEQGAAFGVVVGGIVGAVGGWLLGPSLDDLADRPVIVLAGVLAGAAIGTLIGSFAGMRVEDDSDAASAAGSTGGKHA